MLKIKDLKKHFGGVKAVDDCSFEVRDNTITALIGPNGAGKSTVFNLVSGVVDADGGQIILAGKNITNLSPEKVSNLGIARLFQQSNLFGNLSIRENLILAMDNEDMKFWKNLFGLNRAGKAKKEKAKAALKMVGLEKFSVKGGAGGENTLARDLSFGQKRLVELARTILNPHQLMMLDEPVAGVNPRLRKLISEILLKLKKEGETILLIEHDMNFTLGIADEVIVMEKGSVLAKGTPKQIRNNPEVLEAYFGE